MCQESGEESWGVQEEQVVLWAIEMHHEVGQMHQEGQQQPQPMQMESKQVHKQQILLWEIKMQKENSELCEKKCGMVAAATGASAMMKNVLLASGVQQFKIQEV